MEFWQGHGRLFLQEVASGKRAPVATTGQALDFTPAFSPDGKTLAFSRATEEGTDLYTVNFKRSEEHTSELQSRLHLVCRLLLEKKKKDSSPSTCTPRQPTKPY